MDAPAVALSAVLGLLAGWFVVVPVVERIPEPSPLAPQAQFTVVVLNGALWATDANRFSRWWAVVVYFVVFSTLLAVSVVDLRLFRIPDRIVFPALGATIVLVAAASFVLAPTNSIAFDAIKFALVGMATYFAVLFVFHVAYPRGMGFGDVKLALLMGFSLGWISPSNSDAMYLVFVALFLGCLFGIVFGLAMRLVKGKGGAFPFGPALAAACFYVIIDAQRFLAT